MNSVKYILIDVEKQSGAERQTEGLIVNSSLPMGINLSVLPLRSIQDEFSEIHCRSGAAN